jgi:uncharacterized protein (TIGR03083 family)
MTTPAYSELIAAVRGEGEGIVAAARLGLEAPVPTCPGWDVGRLVRHVSRVYQTAEYVVANRLTQEPEEWPERPEGDPIEVLGSLLDDVVTALREADVDTAVWNWSTVAEPVAGFWARRMAHESSVHRFDAQIAHAMPQPIDAELAGDGIDELVDVLSPRIYARAEGGGPEGSVQLKSSDDGAWRLGLAPGAIQRLDVLTEPDASASGTSSTLLLAAYGRVPWSSLTVEGDIELLERWSATMQF